MSGSMAVSELKRSEIYRAACGRVRGLRPDRLDTSQVVPMSSLHALQAVSHRPATSFSLLESER